MNPAAAEFEHPHVFLGAGHDRNERRTWIVIGRLPSISHLTVEVARRRA